MGIALRAEEILERARMGQDITPEERRHAILFMQGQKPDISQRALAAMFGISETMIRKDISKIKQDMSEEVKSTFLDTVVQDLIAEQHKVYEGLKRSLDKAPLGSNVYVNHLKTMLQVRLDTVRIMQDIGALPKNLGEVSVKKEVFKAEMQPNTNQVIVRPVELFDGFEEGESLQEKLRREGHIETLEREFGEIALALPDSVVTNGQNSIEESTGTDSTGSE